LPLLSKRALTGTDVYQVDFSWLIMYRGSVCSNSYLPVLGKVAAKILIFSDKNVLAMSKASIFTFI
jgi:hypothetical protein